MQYGAPATSPLEIDKLLIQGFDFAEIAIPNRAARRLWWESGIKNTYPDGFFIIAHGPLEDTCPNDVRHLRDHYLPDLMATVDTAFRMGIRFLTIHLTMDRAVVGGLQLAEKVRALKDLVVYARGYDVQIGLENVREDAADLTPVFAAVPGLALTLDVGHGQLATEVNRSFEIIEKLGTSIRHTHFHDNRGGAGHAYDLHLPIGEGRIDFQGILRALVEAGYDGTMTLELKHAALRDSRNRIRRLLEEIARRGGDACVPHVESV